MIPSHTKAVNFFYKNALGCLTEFKLRLYKSALKNSNSGNFRHFLRTIFVKKFTKFGDFFVEIQICKSLALHKKCPNAELFLVRIFPYSVRVWENMNQKKIRIRTFSMQCGSVIFYVHFSYKNGLLAL